MSMANRAIIVAMLAAILIGTAHAADPPHVEWGNYSYSQNSIMGVASNFKIAVAMASLAVVVAAALAYFAAGAFESETLKSWAKGELSQALGSMLIAALLLLAISLMDFTMEASANKIISPCGPENQWDWSKAAPLNNPAASVAPPGSPRAIQYAACYLNGIYGMASDLAQNELKNSLKFSRNAYKREGIDTTSDYTRYASYVYMPNAEMRLQAEMAAIQFDIASKIMLSIQTQKFLVVALGGVVGPLMLAVGIVLRTVPFTRRAGGLLLSLGIGLLIILPSAYLLAWATLVIGVYGTEVLGAGEMLPGAQICAACRLTPPAIYNTTSNKSYSVQDYWALRIRGSDGKIIAENDQKALQLVGMQSCYPSSDEPGSKISLAVSKLCPEICRELPFPAYKQICDEKACGAMPKECKVIRAVGNITHDTMQPYCEGTDSTKSLGCSSACPAECKNTYPQLDLDYGVTANSCDECIGCPYRCRTYYSGTNKLAAENDPMCKSLCSGQNSCWGKFQSGDTTCMYGISGLYTGQGCNHESLCGSAIPLGVAAFNTDPSMKDICPVDCRINFGANEEKMKDPVFQQYCGQGGKFYDACNRCPTACKVNITQLMGMGGIDTGLDTVIRPPSGTCATPPIFENNRVVEDRCQLCPARCRMANPTPSDVLLDPFMMKAAYNKTCKYGTSAYSGSKISEAECETMQGAKGYKTAMVYQETYKVSVDKNENCAPYKTAYVGDTANDADCPRYYNSSGTVVVPPGQYAAPECYSPEAIANCKDPVCPDSCKSGWPPFCTLSPPDMKDSEILENGRGKCADCHTLNAPENTTGPQCQVKLKYNTWENHSALCNSSCYDAACGQDCFPTLVLPNTAPPCGEYMNDGDYGKAAAKWENCAACPYDCRYDYAGSKPANYSGHCGMDMLSNLTSRRYVPDPNDPSQYILDPNQNYWICNATKYATCNNAPNDRIVVEALEPWCSSNGYGCTNEGKLTGWAFYCTARTGSGYVEDHPCYGYFKLDSAHNCTFANCGNGKSNWWLNTTMCPDKTSTGQSVMVDCSWQNYTKQNIDYYKCSPSQDPYAGLNSILNRELGIKVCGDIHNSSNPDYNWCGSASNGTASFAACNLASKAAGGCLVEYDARGAACSAADGLSSSACRSCPPICRVYVDKTYATGTVTVPGYCPQSITDPAGPEGYKAVCNLGNCSTNCRVQAAENKPPANITIDNTACLAPVQGVGPKCPVRCRVEVKDKAAWNIFCDSANVKTDYGISCSDVPQFSCSAEPKADPCEACESCETDCLTRPYVMQNCDEVCGEESGGTKDFNPATMLTNWAGPKAESTHKSLGALAVAGLALPIFALIITLAFVRALSPHISGDIEIPGLSRFL